jgi:NitT/TauT family transport system substrate-binding protein
VPATPVPATPVPVTPSPAPVAEKCNGEKITFLLSFLPNVQHIGFLIADVNGYYEDEGVDVEIQPGAPGVDVTQAVADGSSNLGQIDYVDVVEARAAGVPVKAIAQTYKLPYFFWYANKDSGIDTVADWKDKKVGAIQVGDYPERDAMLLQAGLDPESDIQVTQQEFDTSTFIAGKVDIGEGVVFFHPAYLIGVDGKNYPDDFNVFDPAKLGADFASQTVAGNEEFLAANPAAVKCFLRASIRGWQEAFANTEASVTAIMGVHVNPEIIPEPHQQGAIHSVLPIVGSGADDPTLLELTPDKYQSTIDQLESLGYLEPGTVLEDTYDSSFYDSMGPVTAP